VPLDIQFNFLIDFFHSQNNQEQISQFIFYSHRTIKKKKKTITSVRIKTFFKKNDDAYSLSLKQNKYNSSLAKYRNKRGIDFVTDLVDHAFLLKLVMLIFSIICSM
jgi:hypothetical protein